MDKRAMVAAIAKRTDYVKWKINKIFNPLLDTIIEALQNGDEVHSITFGNSR